MKKLSVFALALVILSTAAFADFTRAPKKKWVNSWSSGDLVVVTIGPAFTVDHTVETVFVCTPIYIHDEVEAEGVSKM